MLATGGEDRIVHLFALPSLNVTGNGIGHQQQVEAVAFNSTSTHLVSGSQDHTAIVWTVPSMSTIRTITDHKDFVYTAVFLSDSYIATGSADTTIGVWGVHTGECVGFIRDHTKWVNALVLSPDGKLLVSASNDKTIKVYDSSTFVMFRSIECANYVNTLAFISDTVVVAGIINSDMIAFDVLAGEAVKKFSKRGFVTGLAVTGMPRMLPSSCKV